MSKARSVIVFLFPAILIIYFFATFIPNIVSWNSALESFFTSGTTKLIWRAAFAILYASYTVVAYFVLKPKINKPLLVFSLLAFFVLLLSPVFNLGEISFVYIDDFQRTINYSIKIGILEILSFYADTLFSLVFLLSLFTVLPILIRESKGHILLFYLFVSFMFFSCLLSYILEADTYLLIIQGNSNAQLYGIASIFPSKNAFGAFLVQAIIISAFMLFRSLNTKTNRKRVFKSLMNITWALLVAVFFVTLFFSFSKNGIGAAFVFAISVIVFFINRFFTKQKKTLPKKIRLVGLFILAILVVGISFMLINPTTRLAFIRALEGRNDLAVYFFDNFKGEQIFLGFGYTLPHQAYKWSIIGHFNSIFTDVHNAYLTVLGMGGIIFFAFYVGLHLYAFRLINQRKNNLMIYVVPSAALLAYAFWAFFESAQIFISGSSASSLMSMLIVAIPLAYAVHSREEVINLETDVG